MSIPGFIYFEGEYRQGEDDWKPLTKDCNISGYEGDLVLRGRFDTELPENVQINSYLEHIGMSIFVNGEMMFESSMEQFSDMCGNSWVEWPMPALESDDVFEIHLHNPHRFGNREAYNTFLNSTSIGSDFVMKTYLEQKEFSYQMLCVIILVASTALIGTAIGYLLMHITGSSLLLKLGIFSLIMGSYMHFDAMGISLGNNRIVCDTYIRQISIIFAGWIFVTALAELFKKKQRQIAEIAVYVLILADLVFMVLSCTGKMRIYDTGIYWVFVQAMVSILMLVLCIVELRSCEKKERILLVSGTLILAAFFAELLNAFVGLWKNDICIKVVFTLLFIIHIIRAILMIAANQKASIKAEELKQEMQNSRTVLAMSQIQTHFIFNFLNAVSGMCQYDPEKADETLVMFSRYLRKNISIMNNGDPEPFTKSLEHLEDYIKLEQIRFGDKIHFEENIETKDFMIPPLILQPVVENAIKHGILKRKSGGTIRLHTWKEMNGDNKVEISDDGVGFDIKCDHREENVGIRNIRFRLKYMINGTMDIKSVPGKGTCVTITIPGTSGSLKGEKKNEGNLRG